MRIYLSGPMSGLPKYNRDLFAEAARVLRSVGHEVFTLGEIRIDNGTWQQYMRSALKGMMDCDKMLLLPGWSKSRGASIEYNLALKLEMPTQTLFEWLAFSEEGRAMWGESYDRIVRLLEQLQGYAGASAGERKPECIDVGSM
ncbi:DUF4406 domain-containing protein [Alicyclobacillus fastidiosus]|uniref:DUF4406 domain-containing protein n=1 Tax=Alicyclobacillus fastidiosus TaxID=392011 RepID=A0ABV5AAD3_9BACL|nr:DUF4406 domain-containing protein [Alicyclobacillus fastidiosus]WEH10957.1 DUF4406 domain-containing protein [Alicyclobacillus fastidiosus]